MLDKSQTLENTEHNVVGGSAQKITSYTSSFESNSLTMSSTSIAEPLLNPPCRAPQRLLHSPRHGLPLQKSLAHRLTVVVLLFLFKRPLQGSVPPLIYTTLDPSHAQTPRSPTLDRGVIRRNGPCDAAPPAAPAAPLRVAAAPVRARPVPRPSHDAQAARL